MNPNNFGVEGHYRFEKFKTDHEGVEIPGSRQVVLDWFPNLITNSGLDAIGIDANGFGYCDIGSGSTPPTVNDTALASHIAGVAWDGGTPSVAGIQSSSPFFGWRRTTFRFPAGVGTGNISEVGVRRDSSSALSSRALILDPSSNPTTISKQADESLDVIYELRMYPPTADASGTVDFGNGLICDWTSRAANVTNINRWAPASQRGFTISPNSALAYTGPLGLITGQPSGTADLLSSITKAAYTPGSYKLQFAISASLSQGNVTGGINSIFITGGTGFQPDYQIEFDPKIPKDGTKTFTLQFEISWERK